MLDNTDLLKRIYWRFDSIDIMLRSNQRDFDDIEDYIDVEGVKDILEGWNKKAVLLFENVMADAIEIEDGLRSEAQKELDRKVLTDKMTKGEI